MAYPYEQVMAGIRALIASGEWESGQKLPTRAQLVKMFGKPRSTIDRAIQLLQYSGELTPPRRGTPPSVP
jgi:DNA-binding GntR family transcriptional regulator